MIRGYHAEIDLNALNRGVQAPIAVQVRPLRRSVIEAFKESVGKLPEVMTVFVIAGGDDFVLHVAVPDLDRLHAFLVDYLNKRGEIVGFRTDVIYQRVHNTVLAPPPRRRARPGRSSQLTADDILAVPGETAQHRLDIAAVPRLHPAARERHRTVLVHPESQSSRASPRSLDAPSDDRPRVGKPLCCPFRVSVATSLPVSACMT